MSKNANLHKAKDAKNDEFYTQLNKKEIAWLENIMSMKEKVK